MQLWIALGPSWYAYWVVGSAVSPQFSANPGTMHNTRKSLPRVGVCQGLPKRVAKSRVPRDGTMRPCEGSRQKSAGEDNSTEDGEPQGAWISSCVGTKAKSDTLGSSTLS